MAADFKSCGVAGCNRNAHHKASGGRGYCVTHLRRLKRFGDATIVPPPIAKARPRLQWLRDHQAYAEHSCLIWPFSRNEHGYGKITLDGLQTRASRVMCQLVHGDPPTPRHEAAHSCGNGAGGCVHPGHLRWATRAENAADAIKHGTWNHGETVPQSKLTETQVREIRALGGTLLQREIAAKYGVTREAVGLILRGDNWAWLA